MVGARVSVPSLGPFPKSALPEPGRGGGVTSTTLGGFGDGAVDEVAVLLVAFGVFLLIVDGPAAGVDPRVYCAGTEAWDHSLIPGAGTIVFIIMGDDVGLFAVGDGGPEL
jgi:hypothetical protein